MRNGTAYRLPPLTHPTSVIASGSSQLWPTVHGFSADGKTNGPSGNELGRAVNRSLWPTPKASAAGPDLAKLDRSSTGISLQTAVALWPTPTSTRRSGLQSHGQNAILGSLNAEWVELLMGIPLGYSKP